ncbi:hypothetical protein FACS189459_3740 [Bacilli bacterium]|nr:hypothetical protein FACS189459_3740 [Bacilli bacterium]
MKTKKRLLYVLIPIICLTVTAAIVLPIVLTQCNNKAKNLVIKNLSKRFNVIRGGYVEKTFTIEDNLGNKIENAEFYDLEFDNQYLDVTLPQKVSNNQYKFTVTGKMIGMSDISFKTKVDSQNLEPAISGSISVNVILNDNDIEIEGCEQMVIVETNEEKTYYFKIISYPSETNISDATFEDI